MGECRVSVEVVEDEAECLRQSQASTGDGVDLVVHSIEILFGGGMLSARRIF